MTCSTRAVSRPLFHTCSLPSVSRPLLRACARIRDLSLLLFHAYYSPFTKDEKQMSSTPIARMHARICTHAITITRAHTITITNTHAHTHTHFRKVPTLTTPPTTDAREFTHTCKFAPAPLHRKPRHAPNESTNCPCAASRRPPLLPLPPAAAPRPQATPRPARGTSVRWSR